jgi:hypothetical protein
MHLHTGIQRSSLLRGEDGELAMHVCKCPTEERDTAKSACLNGNMYALWSSGTNRPAVQHTMPGQELQMQTPMIDCNR